MRKLGAVAVTLLGWVMVMLPAQTLAALPDGRAYEQVSPVDKAGYGVGGNNDVVVQMRVDRDGDRITYRGIYPLPPAESGSEGGFLAQRSTDGWQTTGLLPPPGPNQIGAGQPGLDALLRFTTPDQRTAVYWDNTTDPWRSLGIRRSDGTRATIADAGAFTLAPGGEGTPPLLPGVWGAGISNDGRHVLFATSRRIGDAADLPRGTTDILYEWNDDGSNSGAGSIHVVNRTNDAALALIDPGAAALGGSTSRAASRSGMMAGLRHAISNGQNGHLRIFFQTPAPATDSSTGGPVYMREDGSRTVDISRPEGANPVSSQFRYLDATPDGMQVFFWADGQLTDDAASGGAIYRYDVDANEGEGDLAFVASVPLLPSGAPPTAMASDDGSRVYYERDTALYESDTTGDHLVLQDATASVGAFFVSAATNRLAGVLEAYRGIHDNGCPSANLSGGNGRYFAFVAQHDGRSQIYRYDASAGSPALLISRGVAVSEPYDSTFIGLGCPASALGYPQGGDGARVMSEDGRYVFFDTYGSLVPEDGNGRIDAYRFDGVTGSVALLSSGTAPSDSGFVGTDASGANAFITTDQALVPQDGDGVYDIYDARIGGGFPFIIRSPPCGLGACQGAPPVPLGQVTPGSSTVSGQGNVVEERQPRRGNFSVASPRSAKGPAATLRVRVPSAGRIILTGTAVRAIDKAVQGPAVRKVRVTLLPHAQRKLRSAGSLVTKIRATFVPKAGDSTSKTVGVRFRLRGVRRSGKAARQDGRAHRGSRR